MKVQKQQQQTDQHTTGQRATFIQQQPLVQKKEESLFISSNRVPPMQAKLIIGAPDDPYEREADRMAEYVMRKPASSPPPVISRLAGGPIRRQCLECERDEEGVVQRTCARCQAEAEGMVQRSAESGGGEAPAGFSNRLQSRRGMGSPLPPRVRSQMEQSFGADFSSVRVHTDNEAVRMNREIGARAFTHGADVYFNRGEYSPESAAGGRLLGHELTHVLQQDETVEKIQKFEAPLHESAERFGLLYSHQGRPDSRLTDEEATNIYFGNWMRDVNQAFVPFLSRLLGNDTIFALLNYVASRKFGRLLTPEMLGYYIPAEHMDNPAGLVAQDDLLINQPNISRDARLDPDNAQTRPRGSVTPQDDVGPNSRVVGDSDAQLFNLDQRSRNTRIFNVDQTGTMAFIRRSNLHVERRLLLAARSRRTPEGMLHFGAALHAIEDLFAHSNWIEIAVEKALRDRPDLLPELRGRDREIFNYSTDFTIRGESGEIVRPVLTTGSFTRNDTIISILSEVIRMLRDPLPPRATEAQRGAQDHFVLALLRRYESMLRNNRAFRAEIRRILTEHHVPNANAIAETILNLPLAMLYSNYRQLQIRLPDLVPEAIRNLIRTEIQSIMRRMADRLQAEALEVNVADTSLIEFFQEQRRIASGNNNNPPTAEESVTEMITGTSVAGQRHRARPAASRHVASLQNTPEAVVAGPSHSQISKDHIDSPFFGIAFTMATHAVRRMRHKMVEAWDEQERAHSGTRSRPFNFGWADFPHNRNDRELYHAQRRERANSASEAVKRGKGIVLFGGDDSEHRRFRPFNLQAMRTESADRIRTAASILSTMAESPRRAARALGDLHRQIRRTSIPQGTFRILQDEISDRLDSLSRNIGRSGRQSNTIAELRAISTDLNRIATDIERTSRHAQREQLNLELKAERDRLINSLAALNTPSSRLRAIIIILLNDEISRTAVSYSSRQRDILERSVGTLQQGDFTLPNLDSYSQGIRELIEESRLILNHPYEHLWWVRHVVEYIRHNPDQIRADIEARNEGYAVFRRPGERNAHGH